MCFLSLATIIMINEKRMFKLTTFQKYSVFHIELDVDNDVGVPFIFTLNICSYSEREKNKQNDRELCSH